MLGDRKLREDRENGEGLGKGTEPSVDLLAVDAADCIDDVRAWALWRVCRCSSSELARAFSWFLIKNARFFKGH